MNYELVWDGTVDYTIIRGHGCRPAAKAAGNGYEARLRGLCLVKGNRFVTYP